MIRTKKFENLPQITSISPSGKIVVTENGVDKVISFEDFSNLPPATDVWDNASTTFTASEVNVTDIQSAADSKLLDLKVNTVSKFTITKGGQIIGSAGSALLPTYGFFDSNWGTGYAGWYKTGDMIACSAAGGTATPFSISHIGLKIQNSIPIGWTLLRECLHIEPEQRINDKGVVVWLPSYCVFCAVATRWNCDLYDL
jgi:hypothetical protein